MTTSISHVLYSKNEKWLCIQSHKKQNPKCTQCIINEVVLLYLQHVCCNSWDGIA